MKLIAGFISMRFCFQYKKHLLLQLGTIRQFLLFRMKYVIDGASLFNTYN